MEGKRKRYDVYIPHIQQYYCNYMCKGLYNTIPGRRMYYNNILARARVFKIYIPYVCAPCTRIHTNKISLLPSPPRNRCTSAHHDDDRFFVMAPRTTNKMHLGVTSNFRTIVILNNPRGRTMAIMIYSVYRYTCILQYVHAYPYSVYRYSVFVRIMYIVCTIFPLV